MNDIDWEVVVPVFFMGLLIALFFGVIGDFIFTSPIDVTGEIIGMQYTPASSGVGVGSTGKNPVVVVTSESEKWTLIIKTKNGIKTYRVSAEQFYVMQIGEKVTLKCRKGRIFGSVLCLGNQS